MDTIFAVASARGSAGVAVIRVSGPDAFEACRQCAGDVPDRRVASLRVLRGPDGGRIDEALVLTFSENRSFTGEHVVEFHVHGSPAVMSAVLERLSVIPGLRVAEPGEFTRRAMENGQMNLAQVEGLADLIGAETEAQRRQATRVLAGDLGRRADEWREALVRAAALLEVTIDFVDEDVPVDVTPEVIGLIDVVRGSLRSEISNVDYAERIRVGFEVAIVGAPNVGKSTLLNRLAGREAAITSSVAGTTRDVIEVRMDIEGLPVTLLDTAGLRTGGEEVEAIGIERARDRADKADLRVFLTEGGAPPLLEPRPSDIVRKCKGDLFPGRSASVSGLTGEGVDQLLSEIADKLGAQSAETGLATRTRHAQAMRAGVEALDAAMVCLASGATETELAAEEVRRGVRALDSLVGRVDVEAVLDEIFSSFCLGK